MLLLRTPWKRIFISVTVAENLILVLSLIGPTPFKRMQFLLCTEHVHTKPNKLQAVFSLLCQGRLVTHAIAERRTPRWQVSKSHAINNADTTLLYPFSVLLIGMLTLIKDPYKGMHLGPI